MPEPSNYTVGWICALPTEAVAVVVLLDEEHELPEVAQNDDNSYSLGRMGNHNVVIAVLPKRKYGTTAAATVARDLVRTFPNIRVGLMVGVGGGVPSKRHDIRLGDVVVSSQQDGIGGVFQYDYGKALQDGTFQHSGVLNQPPTILCTVVSSLEVKYEIHGHQLEKTINKVLERNTRLVKKYAKPPATSDTLYESSFVHADPMQDCQELCGRDLERVVSREKREEGEALMIHYGLIASGNQVFKNSQMRDKLAKEKEVLCFEMEAAGLMDHFPCIVIRGICDYSDSHKNKEWRGFAAMAAAAYAKDLLCQIPARKIDMEKRLSEALQNVESGLKNVYTISQEIKSTLHTIMADDEDAKVSAWLSPPHPSSNINKARTARHAGTGTWFTKGDVFSEWKRGERRHLWLRGLPGCGKTVLSVTVLDNLREMADHTMVMFFFDFSDTEKQKLDDMLRSLVCQLRFSRPELRPFLQKLYEKGSKCNKKPSIKALCETFREMLLHTVGNIYILIDAIDECTERGALVSWMQSFTNSLNNLKFIVTGRPEYVFEQSLPVWFEPHNCISFEKQSVDADIRSYVESRVSAGDEFQRWKERPDIVEQIKHAITGNSDGMFRWAACQLDSLEDCRDPESLEDALQSLPADLNGTYARILDSIPESRKKKTIRLLQFLVCAGRPMSRAEAMDVVAIRFDAGYFDPRDRLPRPSEVTAYCAGLISMVKYAPGELSPSGDQLRNGTSEDHLIWLQLAHFSVKEYLMGVHADFRYPDPMATVIRMSLIYLQNTVEDYWTKTPLQKYAARSLMDMGRTVESIPKVLKAITEFFSDERRGSFWVKRGLGDWTSYRPLYVACKNGLLETAKCLVSNNPCTKKDIDILCEELQIAASMGHLNIVQWLVSQGVSTNTRDNPLIAAAHGGHLDIVKWLLDRGTEVAFNYDKVLFGRGSAIAAAAGAGSLGIVRLLAENGANVDFPGEETALYAAAQGGHLDVVRFLLANGADVHLHFRSFHQRGTPIHAAVTNGHLEAVQTLLDHGANALNSCHEEHGTCDCYSPLESAAAEGHMEIIQCLLTAGVPANSGKFGALPCAAAQGFTAIMQLLLKNGAEIEPPSLPLGTALEDASEGGHIDAVQWLLDNGSSVKGAAVHSAATGGHLEIVRLLIARGADVNTRHGTYHTGSALIAAAFGGYYEIVQLLLENGADANATTGLEVNLWNKPSKSALIAAAHNRDYGMVKLLLENGAQADPKTDSKLSDDSRYGSALIAAVCNGDYEMAQLLLENGSQINAKPTSTFNDKYNGYGSALIAAAASGRYDIVKLFLENGADANIKTYSAYALDDMDTDALILYLQERDGSMRDTGDTGDQNIDEGCPFVASMTALAAATRMGCHDIAELLIHHGADVNETFENRDRHRTESPIEAAVKDFKLELFNLLRRSGAHFDPNSPVMRDSWAVRGTF
ncbi:hypothetical protein PWT90_01758 [Aphanocladium album]|nr:hypothetical protein PWT90_01758 [Aphanocladium album]